MEIPKNFRYCCYFWRKYLKRIIMKARIVIMIMAIAVLVPAVSGGCGNNRGRGKGNSSAKESAEKADARGYIVEVGDTVPDFNLLMPDGTALPVKDLRGKVVMLQFTASWCSVCRQEMPHIESEIWQKLKDNPDFAIYGIDFKETPEVAADFAKAIPVTYPITLDPEGERFALFCEKGAGVTRNIVIDRSGRIIMLTRLYDEAEFASMVSLINSELAK